MGNPPLRTRELASARTASGHEHQGDNTNPRLDPAEVKDLAPAWSGEKCAPRTTSEDDRCLPEPVKSVYGVPSGSATPPPDRTFLAGAVALP